MSLILPILGSSGFISIVIQLWNEALKVKNRLSFVGSVKGFVFLRLFLIGDLPFWPQTRPMDEQ